jgi:hypothetical protein
MGVDLTPDCRQCLEKLGVMKNPWQLRWSRLVFGLANAPFCAVSMMMQAVKLAQRAPDDQTSKFRVAVTSQGQLVMIRPRLG